VEQLIDELQELIRARYTVLYLLSWEEERVARLMAQVAAKTRRELVVAAAGSPLVPDGPRLDPEAILAHLDGYDGPVIYLLKDFHHHLDDPAIVRRLRDMEAQMADRGHTLCLLSPVLHVPRELEKDVRVVDIPLPELAEVAQLLAVVIKQQKLRIDVDLFEKFVKASLGLTEKELKRVYTRIAIAGSGFSSEDLDLLIREKKNIIRKSEFLEFYDQAETMHDVGGLDQLKDWLVNRNRAFTEKARKYGLPQPKGLFLVGVQGCGKSLTAKAVASLWRIPLLRIDVGSLLQASGSTEENLRDTIRLAESLSPVVLWIDEIEKAFAGVESGGGDSAGATRSFGQFITWLQEKTRPVFVVATANDVAHLPPELLRKGRFDEIFFVDLPNVHERESIFEIHLRRRQREPQDFDCWRLAETSDKFSGAELEQVVISGMFNAFADGRELATRDLIGALRETVPLAVTMDKRIKELREWARDRTRPATFDTRRVDFFDLDDDDDDLG
jgi:ATP-dependent 26S proteasome regulatory subunit